MRPAEGQWVSLSHAGYHHGFVVGPIPERPDIYDIYCPWPNVGWREVKAAQWCINIPTKAHSDEDWAKFVAFRLTGKQ